MCKHSSVVQREMCMVKVCSRPIVYIMYFRNDASGPQQIIALARSVGVFDKMLSEGGANQNISQATRRDHVSNSAHDANLIDEILKVIHQCVPQPFHTGFTDSMVRKGGLPYG